MQKHYIPLYLGTLDPDGKAISIQQNVCLQMATSSFRVDARYQPHTRPLPEDGRGLKLSAKLPDGRGRGGGASAKSQTGKAWVLQSPRAGTAMHAGFEDLQGHQLLELEIYRGPRFELLQEPEGTGTVNIVSTQTVMNPEHVL